MKNLFSVFLYRFLYYILCLIGRFDPYDKSFTKETYDTCLMHANRQSAIHKASKAKNFGVILGTLGRQGSPKVLEVIQSDYSIDYSMVDYLAQRLLKLIEERQKSAVVVMLSEIFPEKLALFEDVDA